VIWLWLSIAPVLISIWLTGRRKRAGWLAAMLGQACLATGGIVTRQLPLVVVAVTYILAFAWAYRSRWGRPAGAEPD